jgi:hypothetical protein
MLRAPHRSLPTTSSPKRRRAQADDRVAQAPRHVRQVDGAWLIAERNLDVDWTEPRPSSRTLPRLDLHAAL